MKKKLPVNFSTREKYIICKVHGSVLWDGDLFCNSCGKKYRYENPPLKGICSCGAKFSERGRPSTKVYPHLSARMLCPTCAGGER